MNLSPEQFQALCAADPGLTEWAQNTCQHLLRAGVEPSEAAALIALKGRYVLTVEQVRELAAAAELRRPARCKVRCSQLPACPYCAACFAIAVRASNMNVRLV